MGYFWEVSRLIIHYHHTSLAALTVSVYFLAQFIDFHNTNSNSNTTHYYCIYNNNSNNSKYIQTHNATNKTEEKKIAHSVQFKWYIKLVFHWHFQAFHHFDWTWAIVNGFIFYWTRSTLTHLVCRTEQILFWFLDFKFRSYGKLSNAFVKNQWTSR